MEQSGPLLPPENEEVWKMRCEECVRCSTKENCNECEPCQVQKHCLKRRCFQAKRLYQDKLAKEKKLEEKRRKDAENLNLSIASVASGNFSLNEKAQKKGRKSGNEKEKEKEKMAAKKQKEEKTKKERDDGIYRPTRQNNELKRKMTVNRKFEPPRQCLNPDCIRSARTESKYCSDDCGRILARMRLTEVLPARCKEYFSGPRTHETEMERKKMQYDLEMKELHENERKLVGCIERLHQYIGKMANLKPEGEESKIEESLFEACVVCGQNDVPLRKYAKHVETCWARAEKAISFNGAEFGSDRIFCERQDPRKGGFCKRLKSLCPEHRKQGPEQVMNICGYPTKWDNKSYTISEIIEDEDPFGDSGCMLAKDNCSRHSKWVVTLRGSIELEQSAVLLKCLEVSQESRKCAQYSEWSNNVVLAMMHNPKLPHPSTSTSTAET
ncbi:unnamed protein product [Caenorhabditis angaria]|uniref:CXXC-type zinc finger protein 1 n=1 Tax=Caenorhabditis angaria TaxID=860376 RepID=A0A9P1IQJ7_9PELO|nr:unnamed protein product [Caenorhabditis angaria]